MPFTYQGQYYDEEVELAYNRFRWYDNSTGIYISQDPIGLAGNNPNFYAYVSDVNSWIDPLGLMAGIDFSKIAPIDLGEGFRVRKDMFNFKGEADFEVHVYKIKGKKLTEIGVMNSNGGWIPKHGHSGQAPDLPDSVSKKLKNMCKL